LVFAEARSDTVCSRSHEYEVAPLTQISQMNVGLQPQARPGVGTRNFSSFAPGRPANAKATLRHAFSSAGGGADVELTGQPGECLVSFLLFIERLLQQLGRLVLAK
jgi:hypothetical protein